MKSQELNILQYSQATSPRDAITTSMQFTHDILTKIGCRTQMYADHVHPDLAGSIRHLPELAPAPDDILLIHVGWHQDFLDQLCSLRCRKVLFYHNITPPKLIPKDSPNRVVSMRTYAQLSQFREIVEASIADSAFNGRQLEQRGFENVTVIPLFKDFFKLRSSPYVLPKDGKRDVFRILFVGRIVPHKCQLDLVKLVARIRTIGGTPIQLMLIGHPEDGQEYRAHLDRQIKESGLTNQVTITGSISDEELLGHYRSAHAYVSLSEHEGFGVPLVEAMSLDLPVIAFGETAVAETMGGAGVVIYDKETESLRDPLERLHSDRFFRRELLRGQRRRASWFGIERVEEALRDWVSQRGGIRRAASPRTPVNQFLIGGEGDKDLVRYCIEDDRYSTHFGSAGQLAMALSGRPNSEVYVRDLDGARLGLEQRDPSAGRLADLRSLAPPADRTLTIQQPSPLSPLGMIGGRRFIYLSTSAVTVTPNFARAINLHTDGVLVVSEADKRRVRNSGVWLPIASVGRGTDNLKRPKTSAGLRGRTSADSGEPFTFLHISSGDESDALERVLAAYRVAFSNSAPVRLVIKISEREYARIADRMRSPQGALAVQVITEPLQTSELRLLHGVVDAVVLPAFPEEAMAYGTTIIAEQNECHSELRSVDPADLAGFVSITSPAQAGAPSVLALADAMVTVFRRGREAPRTAAALSRSGSPPPQADTGWNDVADRIDHFVRALDARPAVPRKIRIAWLSQTADGSTTFRGDLKSGFDDRIFDLSVDDVRGISPAPLFASDDLAQSIDAAVIEIDLAALLQDRPVDLGVRTENDRADFYAILHGTSLDSLPAELPSSAGNMLRAARAVFVDTENVRDWLASVGIDENVSTLPPPIIRVDSDTNAARAQLGLEKLSPVIGARVFSNGVNVDALITAFAWLMWRYPNAALVLVVINRDEQKSGNDQSGWDETIRRLDLRHRVRFVESLDDTAADIKLALSACDVVIDVLDNTRRSDGNTSPQAVIVGRLVAASSPGFDEAFEFTYRLQTGLPVDIFNTLIELLQNDRLVSELLRKQLRWAESNGWNNNGTRVANVVRGHFEEKHGELRLDERSGVICSQARGTREPNLLKELMEAEFLGLSFREFIGMAFQRMVGRDPTAKEVLACANLRAEPEGAESRWFVLQQIAALVKGAGDDTPTARSGAVKSILSYPIDAADA